MLKSVITRPLGLVVAIAFLSAPTDSFAQVEQTANLSESAIVYPADYFSPFAPRSVLDILERTPGFQIQTVEDRRGLGQGNINVLLNGQVITGKGDNPTEQLNAISSSGVVRVEILDGNQSGVAGLTGRVANVVLERSKRDGSWNWTPVFRDDVEPIFGRLSLSVSGAGDNIEYAVSLNNTAIRLASSGPEFRFDGAGRLFETSREEFQLIDEGPAVSGSLKWTPKKTLEMNMGFEVSQENFNEREISTLLGEGSDPSVGQSLFNLGNDETGQRVNADITFPFWKGTLKTQGFYERETRNSQSISRNFSQFGPINQSRFERDTTEAEAILRSEYDITNGPNKTWQLAGEYARNTLDADTRFLSSQGNNPLVLTDFGNPNNRVSEDRFEATLTHSRKLAKDWDFQTAIGAEYSTLTQNADTFSQSRSFFRPKGYGSFTWSPDSDLSFTARLERDVGQLNFLDFTSSINLEDDTQQAGNSELVPQQAWIAKLSGNKTFSGGHVLDFSFSYENISDIVDRIPIGVSGEGIGNIPSAQRYSGSVETTLKGDDWGMPGLEFNLEFQTRSSSVTDPAQGFKRQLNSELEQFYAGIFRYDKPHTNWAIGGAIERSIVEPVYRLQSIDQLYRNPFTNIYVEHKDIYGLKVRATVFALTNYRFGVDRQFFDARRDIGQKSGFQTRERSYNPFLQFDISGTF